MDLSSIISSLSVAGVFADLIFGIIFYKKAVFLNSKFRLSILFGGFFAMLWNMGIAWYSYSYDFNIAKYGVYICIWGFDAFFIFLVFFVGKFIGLKPKVFHIYLFVGVILSIADGFIFGMGDVHEYVRVGTRTAYLTYKCWQTNFHFAYIMGYAIIWNIQVFYYSFTQPIKRLKVFCLRGTFCIWITFFLSIPDTLLPALNIPSLPLSGIGVTIGYIFLMRLALKLDLFSVSRDNFSDYIYNLPNVGILIFDLTWNLSISNSFAEKLLGITPNSNLLITDILKVTEENLKLMENEQDLPEHIFSVKNQVPVGISTSVVKDSYKEPLCYILVVSDMTYEEEKAKLVLAKTRKQQIDKMLIQLIETLSFAIDAKDKYIEGHSARVSNYSVMIAKKLGLDEDFIENTKYAGLLHDIGKIGIPDSILKKPGKLSPEEYEIIKSHTTTGANILSNLDSLPKAMDVAKYHHERYDGSGYPEGLKGEEIPLITRIVSVADVYDAMYSKRIYREKMNVEYIRNELIKGKGSQFDPKIVDIFIEICDENNWFKSEKTND